jgi:hypothetical protein
MDKRVNAMDTGVYIIDTGAYTIYTGVHKMDTGINIIYTEVEESTAEIQQTAHFGYRVNTINTESITKGARDHLMYFMKKSTLCTYI